MSKSTIAQIGDVAETVSEYVLPGMLGKIVAKAIDSLTEDDRSNPNKIMEAVRKELSAPEQLKQLEMILSDKQQARTLQREAIEKGGKASAFIHATTPPLLTYFLASVLSICIFLLFKSQLPPEHATILMNLIGQVQGAFLMACAFWYGSGNDSTK